jgi:hypothetical protein
MGPFLQAQAKSIYDKKNIRKFQKIFFIIIIRGQVKQHISLLAEKASPA